MHKMLPAAAALVASAGAYAHPGHHEGSVAQALSHIWTHADHWLPVVAVLGLVAASTAWLRSRAVLRREQVRGE